MLLDKAPVGNHEPGRCAHGLWCLPYLGWQHPWRLTSTDDGDAATSILQAFAPEAFTVGKEHREWHNSERKLERSDSGPL